MRLLLLCVLILTLASEVAAEMQYWVAVGSYQDPSFAEEARTQAAASLPQSFTITPVVTDTGYFYRVLAGPYLSQEIADDWMREAIRLGFVGAWLLAEEADQSIPGLSDFSTTDFPAIDDSAFDEALPKLQLEERLGQQPEREVIEEAPADYFLHKLYRGNNS